MRQIYDWDGWFALGRITLQNGRDYHVSQSTMCQIVRNAASRRGLRVRVEDIGDRIVVDVVGRRHPTVLIG